MPFLKILILAIVQGLAELLPVSSSAHVVVAEKLMKMDPSSAEMTLVLVMLHTGTMFSVIVYFWKQWKRAYFSSEDAFKRFAIRAVWASFLTAIIGYPIIKVIEKTMFRGAGKAEVEMLFSRLDLIGCALLAAGLLILWSGLKERNAVAHEASDYDTTIARTGSRVNENVTFAQAGWMGAVQGLCLPFRGFSRSGATISTGMLVGAARERAEKFSFALAVIITPPAIARESMRLLKASHEATAAGTPLDLHASLMAALVGMVFSFIAGLAALKWLSSWLESGKWYLFGIYCLLASGVVFYLNYIGY